MVQFGLEMVAALLEAIGEAVLVAAGDGQVVAANQAMAELLAQPGDSLAGLSLLSLSARGHWVPPTFRRCVETGHRQTFIQEVRGRRLVLTASPLPGGLVAVGARDITELDRLQRQAERMEQDRQRARQELAGLRAVGGAPRPELVASSQAMQQVLDLCRRVAGVDSTVLLLGESGVGKSVLARAIHDWSGRAGAPFVKVNCAAIAESLLESELFGYAPGSFTGARREGKPGIIEQAHGGTLFLDEIGDLPPALQVKLLHVIQERRFTRVGSVVSQAVDVRIIAATHQDLERLVAEQRFRQDLFYRLHVVPITVPPLRERPEEIPALVHTFLAKLCARYGVRREITAEAMDRLLAHAWPGNVRELENLLERLVVTTEGCQIRATDLPAEFSRSGSPVAVRRVVPLAEALAALEMELVGAAYRQYGSSVKVGEVLGIHQTSAARKIREWKARAGAAADQAHC